MFAMLCRLAALTVMLALAGGASSQAMQPTGTWLTQKGDAQIRVARCGASMCGTVVWLRNPTDPRTGQAPIDSRNPDPNKRGRKIMGMRIFAMASDGRGGWAGDIYNSDDGQTYDGRLIARGDSHLQVQGCAGPLCGSETWTKTGR